MRRAFISREPVRAEVRQHRENAVTTVVISMRSGARPTIIILRTRVGRLPCHVRRRGGIGGSVGIRRWVGVGVAHDSPHTKQRKGNGPHNQQAENTHRDTCADSGLRPSSVALVKPTRYVALTLFASSVPGPACVRLRAGHSVAHDLSIPSPSAPSSSHAIGTAVIAAQVVHRRDAQPPCKSVRGQ